MFGPTTQLEAVNTILATIGEAPVASLTGPMTSDAPLALGCLNEITKLVQTDGLPWNTERLPAHARRERPNLPPVQHGGRRDQPPVLHDHPPVMRYNASGLPYLYDRLNQTDTFTTDLVADRLVRWLDWAELPEAARRYITMRASRSSSATAPSVPRPCTLHRSGTGGCEAFDGSQQVRHRRIQHPDLARHHQLDQPRYRRRS
jgi:hypothetical protein